MSVILSIADGMLTIANENLRIHTTYRTPKLIQFLSSVLNSNDIEVYLLDDKQSAVCLLARNNILSISIYEHQVDDKIRPLPRLWTIIKMGALNLDSVRDMYMSLTKTNNDSL